MHVVSHIVVGINGAFSFCAFSCSFLSLARFFSRFVLRAFLFRCTCTSCGSGYRFFSPERSGAGPKNHPGRSCFRSVVSRHRRRHKKIKLKAKRLRKRWVNCSSVKDKFCSQAKPENQKSRDHDVDRVKNISSEKRAKKKALFSHRP